ncbi:MAG: hypothetical protein RDV48_27730 [Candidatus Eremiobacteraeota bacterium]|nr:hypothetical protein [Candidatus Eremiobacteraeota bacterium]
MNDSEGAVKAVVTRGSTLMLTLIVGAIIFMLAVTYSTFITVQSRSIEAKNNSSMALYVADAGVKRAFVEVVNMEPAQFADLLNPTAPPSPTPSPVYNGTPLQTSDGMAGSYVSCFAKPVEINTEATGTKAYGWVPILQGDPYAPASPSAAKNRGRYRYKVDAVSTGTITRTRDNEVLARKTLRAKFFIERAEKATDYRGYGIIYYWSEMNR